MSEEKKLTGYPSIDKPWLKYWRDEVIAASLPDTNMFEYMVGNNKKRLNAVALDYFGTHITHCLLQEKITECAKSLVGCGIKNGDQVALCMLTIPEAVYLLYAVNRIGAICNFLVLNATEAELHKQLAESKIVITVDLALDKMQRAVKNTKVERIISVSIAQSMPFPLKQLAAIKNRRIQLPSSVTSWRNFIKLGKGLIELPNPGDSDSIATLCHTGGTTGESKGVLQSNRAGNALAFHYICAAHFHKGDAFLDILPPFLAYGLYVGIHMPLCAGMEVILYPDPSPEKFPALIQKKKPNHFAGGPLHIEKMISDKHIQKMDLSFLATAAYGGDKASDDWMKGVNTFLKNHHAPNKLHIGYGMTETAGTFCTTTPEQDQMIPFPNNNIRIIDVDTGADLPCGKEGEICLSGPTIMQGYYNVDSEQDVIWEERGSRWLHTGDLGYVTDDGHFIISGRIKRVSWARGEDGVIYRVYPVKIEESITKNTDVRQCCVVNKPDDMRGNLFIAFLVLADKVDSNAIVPEIKKRCKSELPESSQPTEYIIMDSLPLTGAGKIDYRALEKMAKEM